jgi:nitroreductase
MDGFDFEAVAEIAKLPPDYEIAYMISVGKGTKQAWPKPGQLHLDDVVIEDRLEL